MGVPGPWAAIRSVSMPRWAPLARRHPHKRSMNVLIGPSYGWTRSGDPGFTVVSLLQQLSPRNWRMISGRALLDWIRADDQTPMQLHTRVGIAMHHGPHYCRHEPVWADRRHRTGDGLRCPASSIRVAPKVEGRRPQNTHWLPQLASTWRANTVSPAPGQRHHLFATVATSAQVRR
jgi:hypothetical protein